MEISKKDLLQKLDESANRELDELADYKTQKGLEKNWEPIYSEPQTDIPGYEGSYTARGYEHTQKDTDKLKGKHIGHRIKDTATKEPIAVLYPCKEELVDFIRTHAEVIDFLNEKYGEVYFSESKTIPYCQKRKRSDKPEVLKTLSGGEKEFNITRQHKTELSSGQYLKKYLLYPNLKEIIGDEELAAHMQMCMIPRIKINERAHLDRHSEFASNKLTYQTMNYNSYESSRDFYEAAVRNVKKFEEGVDVNTPIQDREEREYREYHLQYQFNKIYRKWEETKKSQDLWLGLTPTYNLEHVGLSPTTFDATVMSLLTIKGELREQENILKFVWTVEFKVEHGNDLKHDPSKIVKHLSKDEYFESQAEADITDIQYDYHKKDAIAKHPLVIESLQNVLNDIKAKIMAIPVVDALKKAQVSSFQLSGDQRADLEAKRKERLERLRAMQQPETQEEPPQLSESDYEFLEKRLRNIIQTL